MRMPCAHTGGFIGYDSLTYSKHRRGDEERSAGGGMRRWRAPIREAGRCDELGPVRHGTAAGKRVYALLLGRGGGRGGGWDGM